MNIAKDKGKNGLFVILVLLSIFFKANRVELFFGIIIDLSNLFLILVLLTNGLKRAVLGGIITYFVGYLVFQSTTGIELIYLIELMFLATMVNKKKKNIIVCDSIFWLIIIVLVGIFITFNKEVIMQEYRYLLLLFAFMNGILNSLVADILNLYFIERKILNKKITIDFKTILLHLLISAILMPCIINIVVDLVNSYNSISGTARDSAKEIAFFVEDELKNWDENRIANLKLHGLIEVGLLKDSVKKFSRYKEYNIHIVDKNNKKVLDVNNYTNIIEDYEKYSIHIIEDNLYELIPLKNSKGILNRKWSDGYFLYTEIINNSGLKVLVEVPIEIYKNNIISEYLSQLKFLILFALFTVFISKIINKAIFNNLYSLSSVTKDLPNKIENNVEITWPSSNIAEINLLIENNKKMALNLSENFRKLNNSKKKLYELAYYDSLTKLPNRLCFKKSLKKLIKLNKSEDRISVMFIDLNKFKSINDRLGHDIGDKFLSAVAERFKEIENNNFKFYRLGGDEFVAILDKSTEDTISKSSNDILKVFEREFKIENVEIKSSCSVGVSIYPNDGQDINTIIKYADMAMYVSKEKSEGSVQLFNEDIKKTVVEQITIEKELEKAIVNEEFRLYYQPKISAKTGEIVSLEALIRWENQWLGFVSPEKFISIAEESELIILIDQWVIFEVCRFIQELTKENFNHITVSINISAKYIERIELVDKVKKALEVYKIDPKYLTIEITEGVLIREFQNARKTIEMLNDIGVKVSIDDFGKGYSSLNQLISLPVNEVKIDRELIKDIDKNYKKQSVAKFIVDVSHTLNLNVVAEGVETKGEKEYLNSIRCDELQGYYFSKAKDSKDIKNELKKREGKYEKE